MVVTPWFEEVNVEEEEGAAAVAEAPSAGLAATEEAEDDVDVGRG